MKLFSLALILAALAIPAGAQQLVPARQQGVLAVPLVADPPAIDGKLDDPAWARAQPLKQFAFRKKAVALQTEGWICRDQKNLYFAARCFDDKLDELVTAFDGNAIWKNDCIELFIAPEKRDLFFCHLAVSCDGMTSGGTWVPDEWGEPTHGRPLEMTAKTGREAKAWTMELAVPIAAFGFPITPQSVWALGFNREKHTDPEEVSGFQGGFNSPREYPDLVFDGRTVVFDGIGVRNVGTAPQRVTATVVAGGQRTARTLDLAPGKSIPLDWQAAAKNANEGDTFTVEVAGADGKPLGRESYTLVAPSEPVRPAANLAVVPAAKFRKSVLDDPDFFPISVWLQPAGAAAAYKAMGVNVYVGGSDAYPNPKDGAFLESVQQQGMFVICPYKKEYVTSKLYEHPAFLGWMFGDEPDNVDQATGRCNTPPDKLIKDFARVRNDDPTHPVYLNLGCGVADERFVGRAATDEEYQAFARCDDILSYDVYPCNSIAPNGPDRLCLVAKGIDRLRQWGGPDRRVWCWIEANKFGQDPNQGRSPTPDEVKTMIWMALVHGARGYGFFCHTWYKTFRVNGIEPAMQQALAPVNLQVQALARVLNSPTVANGASVKVTQGSRVDVMVKKVGGATYAFAVNMYRKPEKATITLKGVGAGKAEVLGEERTLDVRAGALTDDFAAYAVHLYKVQ